MDPVLKLFLSKVYTKNQALKSLRVVKDFINFLLFENTGQNLGFEEGFAKFQINRMQRLSNELVITEIKIIKGLGEGFFRNFNQANVNTHYNNIEKAINTTKMITFHLPFELPEAEGERLGFWIKQNLGDEALFETSYDPTLIGGCALSVNGIYKDYSIRQKIKDEKEKILGVLLGFRR